MRTDRTELVVFADERKTDEKRHSTRHVDIIVRYGFFSPLRTNEIRLIRVQNSREFRSHKTPA